MAAVITKPALLVSCFVPSDPYWGPSSHRYLARLWQACRHLGMDTALTGLPCPAELPPFATLSPRFRVLAAATRSTAGQVYSVFVFAEHDVVGLVCLLAPNTVRGSLRQWSDLLGEWTSAVRAAGAERPDGVLGEFLVFEALYRPGGWASGRRLSALVRDNAPIGAPGAWWEGFDRTDQGIALWTALPESGDIRRAHYVLAPERREDALDEWAWAKDGHSGLRPLTRYLLHAAKIRYESQRYAELPDLYSTIEAGDRQSEELLRQLQSVRPDGALPLRRVLRAAALLDGSRLGPGPGGMLWTATRLRQLARTVSTALDNARLTAPTVRRRGSGMTMADHDCTVAEMLIVQIESDLVHLEAARERAEATHALTTTLVDRALEARGSRLALLQTSVLSGVLMALTAVQAFGYRVPLNRTLQTPTIALLGVAALAFPLVVLRWAGLAGGGTPYRWTIAPAAGLFGAALGWLIVTASQLYGGHGTAAAIVTLPWAVGCGLLLGGVTWFFGRRR